MRARRFLKKLQETINEFTLWSRGRHGVIFARQLEPTKGLFEDGYNHDQALLTPILVGREGEVGRDLDDVLAENEKLKRRVERLERPWWKRQGGR